MLPAFQALQAALAERPLVMGILNVTPDSFSDGGRWLDPARALDHAEALFAAGADLIDVGGESTRPGAPVIGLEEELARVLPVAEGLAKRLPGRPWSIDTQKAELAKRAVAAGACLINDVSALRADPAMLQTAAASEAGVCLMHRLEAPAGAKWAPDETTHYGREGVTRAVRAFLAQRLNDCTAAGLGAERVWLDPGLGFGKTVADNLALLRELRSLTDLGCPVLVGPSRKSFIGAVLGGLPIEERLEGTLAACAAALLHGARILRVHDVREAVRATRLIHAIQGNA
jgi:dihydropteroate synthase